MKIYKIIYKKNELTKKFVLVVPSSIPKDKEEKFIESVLKRLEYKNNGCIIEKTQITKAKDLEDVNNLNHLLSPILLSKKDAKDYIKRMKKFISDMNGDGAQKFELITSLNDTILNKFIENDEISFFKNKDKVFCKYGYELCVELNKLYSKSLDSDIFGVVYFKDENEISLYEMLFQNEQKLKYNCSLVKKNILNQEKISFFDLRFLYFYDDIKHIITTINESIV